MGFAKLNIWIRDQQGRVVDNPEQTDPGDWVAIWRPGEYVAPGPRPATGVVKVVDVPGGGAAHVEVDVPPGCYIVQGHLCWLKGHAAPAVNEYTNAVMINAHCGQEETCVNLLMPDFNTCVSQILPPLLEQVRLREREIAEVVQHIPLVTSVLLRVAGIQRDEYRSELELAHPRILKTESEYLIKKSEYGIKIASKLPNLLESKPHLK